MRFVLFFSRLIVAVFRRNHSVDSPKFWDILGQGSVTLNPQFICLMWTQQGWVGSPEAPPPSI